MLTRTLCDSYKAKSLPQAPQMNSAADFLEVSAELSLNGTAELSG